MGANEKKERVLLNAIKFMFSNAWKRKRSIFLDVSVLVLTYVSLNLIELYMGPHIISIIEQKLDFKILLRDVFIMGISVMLIEGVDGIYYFISQIDRMQLRLEFVRDTFFKAFVVSYQDYVGKIFTAEFGKTEEAMYSNHAPLENFWVTATDFLKSAVMFVAILYILRKMPLYIVVLTVLSAVCSFVISAKSSLWEKSKSYEKNSAIHRMETLKNQMIHSEYGKDIRYFGMQNYMVELWERSYKIYVGIKTKAKRGKLAGDMIELLLALIRNGLMFYILITRVSEGLINVSEFLLYFGSVSLFTSHVMEVLNHSKKLYEECVVIVQFKEYLNFKDKFKFEEGLPLKLEDREYEIEFVNVSFRYEGQKDYVIENLSFKLKPYEKLAIVGLNGAGKTTLIKLMLGLYDPCEGAVLLNGQDIRQYNRWDYYDLFSAVFQEHSLIAGTILDNVKAVGSSDDRALRALKLAGMSDKIDKLENGVDTKLVKEVYDDAVELSGGELQKLLLARAICKPSAFLILDEPTAALDPIAESLMYEKYNELTEGKSSVFISHRLATTRFCDRILMLKGGAIVEEGTHGELMQFGGEYAKLFDIQSQYYKSEVNLNETVD